MTFQNRKQAGILLAPKLFSFRNQHPLILALPRGGAPIAAEIAERLECPWDVLLVRKIGAPFHPELAVGAICENDEPYFNSSIIAHLGMSIESLEPIIEFERNEIARQQLQFRAGQPLPSVKNRTVLVVDDGLATGATMMAAILFLRKQGAKRVVVAVPIAAASSAETVRDFCDEVIALQEPLDLYAVGNWYQDFSQVSDEEVQALLSTAASFQSLKKTEVALTDKDNQLMGDLTTLQEMKGLIVFAHGSGSSRHSPRNQMIARALNHAGFGTYLLDLLTIEESRERQNVFDLELLSRRLVLAVEELRKQPELKAIPYGLFGASTGAGAALRAAADLQKQDPPFAVVSRGGRPDLAGDSLKQVQAPTLLIVGERDPIVIELNEEAQWQLENAEMVIIPRATHLFEEEGTLEEVAKVATDWFTRHCEHPVKGRAKKFQKMEKGRESRHS